MNYAEETMDGDGGGDGGGQTYSGPAPSVNDYNLPGGTTEQMNQLGAALSYLDGSATFSNLLDRAQSANITIVFTNDMNGSATIDASGNKIIHWNPDAANGTSSGGWQSPATVLGAEIAHLVEPNGMSGNPGDFYWNGDLGEQTAHDLMNVVLGELGEPLRLGYADAFMFPIDGVTSSGTWGFGDLNRISEVFQTYDHNGYIDSIDFAGDLQDALMGSGFGNASLSIFDGYDWGSGGGGGSFTLDEVFEALYVEIAFAIGA